MNGWTRADATRRRLTVIALVAGPLIALVSALLAHPAGGPASADVLDAVGRHRDSQLAQVLLELLGTVLLFAGVMAASGMLRHRGAGLATAARVLGLGGIVGFTIGNTEGAFVNALAGLSDRGAATTALDAIDGSVLLKLSFLLIVAGEAGLVCLIGGYLRAGLVPLWLLVIGVADVVVDFLATGPVLLAVTDGLELVIGIWLAVTIARLPSAVERRTTVAATA